MQTKLPVGLLQVFGVFAGRIRLAGHCAVFRAGMLGVNFGTSSFSHSMKWTSSCSMMWRGPFLAEIRGHLHMNSVGDMTPILSLPSPWFLRPCWGMNYVIVGTSRSQLIPYLGADIVIEAATGQILLNPLPFYERKLTVKMLPDEKLRFQFGKDQTQWHGVADEQPMQQTENYKRQATKATWPSFCIILWSNQCSWLMIWWNVLPWDTKTEIRVWSIQTCRTHMLCSFSALLVLQVPFASSEKRYTSSVTMTSRTAEASEAFDLDFNGPLGDLMRQCDGVFFWLDVLCFSFFLGGLVRDDSVRVSREHAQPAVCVMHW